MTRKGPVRYSLFPDGIRPSTTGKYVLLSDYRKVADLLERFSELYGETQLSGSMIKPGHNLWREYHEYSGDHLILTDEGWEPGESKVQYLHDGGEIYDEANAPDRKRK